MAVVQVPPAVGSSGQQIDVFQLSAGSTTFREIVAIGSAFTSSGLAVVTTSGGILASLSSGTVTLSSATALSSGIVTLSSVHTVTATAATNPWSSAPSFNLPLVSASSGLIQISGTPTVVSASSGLVQISGTPTITVVGTSGAIAPATSSGGLGVTILGGAASGSTSINVVGSSGAIAQVTSSGGLGVTILAGAGAGSTQVHVVGTSGAVSPVTSSGGLLVTLAAGSTVGTNPWSSAPAFPIPVVSASSGTVQVGGTVTVVSASSGLVQIAGTAAVVSASSGQIQVLPLSSGATTLFGYVSSSSANSNLITNVPVGYYGAQAFNTTGTLRYVHIYHTSSAPGVGTTANWAHTFAVPYSTAGGGGVTFFADLPLSYSTKGLGITITDGPSSTSTGTIGQNDILLTVRYMT